MRGELHLWDDSIIAEAAVTDKSVIIRGTDKAKGKVSDGDNAANVIGISQQQGPTGNFTSVRRLGVAEVIAAEAMDPGDIVVGAADGKVKKLASVAGSLSNGDVVNVVGTNESKADAANDVVEVSLNVYTYTISK